MSIFGCCYIRLSSTFVFSDTKLLTISILDGWSGTLVGQEIVYLRLFSCNFTKVINYAQLFTFRCVISSSETCAIWIWNDFTKCLYSFIIICTGWNLRLLFPIWFHIYLYPLLSYEHDHYPWGICISWVLGMQSLSLFSNPIHFSWVQSRFCFFAMNNGLLTL